MTSIKSIGLDRLSISEKFDGLFWLAHLTVDGKNTPFLTVYGKFFGYLTIDG